MQRTPRWLRYLRIASVFALTAVLVALISGLGAMSASRADAYGGRRTGTGASSSMTGATASGRANSTDAATPATAATAAGSTAPASAAGVAAPIAASDVAARFHRGTTTTVAPRVTTTTNAPATTVAPAGSTGTTAPAGSASGKVLLGVVTDTMAQLDTFNADAGKKATLYSSYYSFANDANFDAAGANAVVARGAQPMVTWEPWDPNSGSATQPAYSLASIISGNYDAYITHWATEIKAWNQPLWLRFAHEMNGNWYPWAEGVNGNTAGQYVAAYRHVHDLFQRAGVTKVTWVWTPNTIMGATPTLASLYPGDAYVDWIGVDGYNWGTTQSWGSTWQTPTDVFGPTLSALEQISGRPIIIGETASAEQGGSKATWTSQFFSFLAAQPRIKAFVWFNLNKETDWRIESSAGARSAFATGVANSRY